MIRRHATRLVALGLLAALYGFARLPELPEPERQALSSRFSFERAPLPLPPGAGTPRNIRDVHPGFYRIASWVSAIGASVALNDLDGDGLPNDLCAVDTRFDRAFVAPAPGTGERFAAFNLEPDPLPYDRRTMAPMGCMAGDWNEDGGTDLLVHYWGRTPVVFLRRAGGPLAPAAFRPLELVAEPQIWNTAVATQADLDGDGHVDLVFGNYFQDGARVLDSRGEGREQMQAGMSRAYNGGLKHVFLWAGASAGPEPSVRFAAARDVFTPEVAAGWTLAIAAADLDGDLLPELYIGNDFGPDRLLHNRSTPGRPRFVVLAGEKTFTMPNSKVLGRDSYKGMGVDFGDLNGDGLLDLYVSNIANEFALEESHFAFVSTGEVAKMKRGVAPYVERSESLGLSRSAFSWEARLSDYDNDGVLEAQQATGFVKGTVNRWPELQELAMGNDQLLSDPRSWPRFRPGTDLSGNVHNPFFVRSASGRYFDLAAEVGIGDPQVSRGIATADVDRDGDLDFAVANQWETSYFYTNRSRQAGAHLGLDLRLPAASALSASRPAIGAVAVVHLPDGRRLVGQVDGGNGHSGDRSPELHFGLGQVAAGTPLKVDVRYRDARGVAHQDTLRLTAGWHTIVLGREGKES